MKEPPLQEQLLTELATFIREGRVVVHDNDEPWFHLIRQRYPMTTSGVDWEAVPGAQSDFSAVPAAIPNEGIHGSVPVQQHSAAIRSFLTKYAESAGLRRDDNVVVLGDGITDIALEMSVSTLLEVFPILFSYPQHVCIITPDASWCFIFKFEFDMYFGQSPVSSVADRRNVTGQT